MNLNASTAGTYPVPNGPQPGGRERLSRTTESLALSELRSRLLQEALGTTPGHPLGNLLRLAAGEAEAQAWLTPFPLLLFPELFEEKARQARCYVARQRRFATGPPGRPVPILNGRADRVGVR